MLQALFKFYWIVNRPFLRAFSEALIGPGEGALAPDGRRIVAKLESLLREMPPSTSGQATLALFLMPYSVPKALPYNWLARLGVRAWHGLLSQVLRYFFPLRGRALRAAKVDQIFRRLNNLKAQEESDLIKGIIMLGSMKTLLTSSYLDLDETWKGIGYKPYTERDWNPPSGPDLADPPELPTGKALQAAVHTAREVADKPAGRTTYLVLGSGAGGGVAAYTILENDPDARIVIVDSGPLYTNAMFPTHLMDSAAKLYMNGGMTLSANQKYTFVQGRLVGGGTELNNSVALFPDGFWWDDVIVKRWSWFGAELDYPRLHDCYREVMQLINAGPLDERVLTDMSVALREGFADIGMDPQLVTCNLKDCIGCGRCNVGCQYGAKQSMGETLLPKVAERGGLLVPNTHVKELALDGDPGSQVCRGAWVRDAEGNSVLIEADKVLLAAGAYASTKILRRSGFRGKNPGVRTVGKRFSGNMGTPVFGIFERDLTAWKGQQVGYMIDMKPERLVIETAFAPPPAYALQSPQWGRAFMQNVEAFDQMGVAIPVWGTDAYGDITIGPSPSGFSIYFELNDTDWMRLGAGMKRCAEALFDQGAKFVYDTRFSAESIRRPEEIDDWLSGINPLSYLKITTAHLQGGNVIHHSPNQGVVDAEMRVHGIDRLWITDASVIPAPVTLNVQTTVMALARYAAPGIAAA